MRGAGGEGTGLGTGPAGVPQPLTQGLIAVQSEDGVRDRLLRDGVERQNGVTAHLGEAAGTGGGRAEAQGRQQE